MLVGSKFLLEIKGKIIMAEIRCLRGIVNGARRDKISNGTTRTRTGVTPVKHYVLKQEVIWFGHVTRLPTDSLEQTTFTLRFVGNGERPPTQEMKGGNDRNLK